MADGAQGSAVPFVYGVWCSQRFN